MEETFEPVNFDAHPSAAAVRRVMWWIVPLMVLPIIASFVAQIQPAVAVIVVGTVPLCAMLLMPRLVPLSIELQVDGMRFGSGLTARRIRYDDVLVVDLRRTSSEDAVIPQSDAAPESATKADPSSAAAMAMVEPWRITIHSSLVPVSVALAVDDANAVARTLHQMCPSAALWDADGRLLEPLNPEEASKSIRRVKRMAMTRRVLSAVGGILSLGAFLATAGGGVLSGVIGQILPFFWIGMGAGLFGLAAGAEKSVLTGEEPRDSIAANVSAD